MTSVAARAAAVPVPGVNVTLMVQVPPGASSGLAGVRQVLVAATTAKRPPALPP